MATRSRIGYQLKDGSIVSVYHHWDGYPTGLGAHLVAHYSDIDDIRELIDGGDLSTCIREEGPEYYADRGETDVEPQLSISHDEFVSLTDECTGEYAYAFVNGTWTCYDVHESKYISLYEEVKV